MLGSLLRWDGLHKQQTENQVERLETLLEQDGVHKQHKENQVKDKVRNHIKREEIQTYNG